MSCCGGNCGCGASCKCGSGCVGCKMYPDLCEGSVRGTPVLGFVQTERVRFFDAQEEMFTENGCKCGNNCTCDSCNCK